MATILKIQYVHYVDGSGQRVPKGTSGAKKVVTESSKYYACYREGSKQVRIPLATDKTASQAMLADILRAKERGQAGLVDPFREQMDKPLSVHIEDYMANVRATTGSEQHHKETERILNVFVRDSKATTLREVTPDRVTGYLNRMTAGPTTRNMHRRIIVMFMNWCEGVERIERNPITNKSVKTSKRKGEKRKRRALSADEVRKLIDAVREYPLATASVNRGGRNAKTKPVDRPAKLTPATVTKLQQRGRERSLLYRLAVLTGLRRAELSRLQVTHLDLDRQPLARIVLPAHLTKNRRQARILLVPSLAEDLRQWIKDTGKGPSDVVVNVPSRCNMAKLHKAHLAMAGIPYADQEGKFADFHSLRMAANVVLRKAGIPPKERQLFLRHSKLELTTETYDDESATEMPTVVRVLAESHI